MKSLETLRILVVGDIMLDHYVLGEVERISPEAPVPIVKVSDEYFTLGGCGNVVRNIRELGPQVDCLTSTGWDRSGEIIEEELEKIEVKLLTVHESKVTTTKQRVIADERKIQMIRVDRESTKPINHALLINRLEETPNDYDMIVVSDYAKGVISHKLMAYLHHMKFPIIVDPKPKNQSMYGRVYMITPNEKEWSRMEIEDQCSAEYTLITEGQKGMTLYDNISSVRGKAKIKSEAVQVYNVSGAGDTVVAVMATCLSMGYPPYESAHIANKCAAYVVTQTGTTVVPRDEFLKHLTIYYTT